MLPPNPRPKIPLRFIDPFSKRERSIAMKRSTRSDLAHETVSIVDRGFYTLGDGRGVDLSASIRNCLASTELLEPDELEDLRNDALSRPNPEYKTLIEVRNETTLEGIARLVADGDDSVAALNFASAKNPGGGFLKGSQAQEESLARSSALYASLLRAPDYYGRHRSSSSMLYSDAMILSPGCPIFRDDEGELLEVPRLAHFITSAAPNAGAASNRPSELAEIPTVFRRRAEYVLALAAARGYECLVLGAWGCGVFRNDPKLVARVFAEHLRGIWAGRFRRVTFSVLDTPPRQETYRAFEAKFGSK